jgi:hypothetical protein
MGFFDDFQTNPLEVLAEFNEIHGTDFDSVTSTGSGGLDLDYGVYGFSFGYVSADGRGCASFEVRSVRELVETGLEAYCPGHRTHLTSSGFCFKVLEAV